MTLVRAGTDRLGPDNGGDGSTCSSECACLYCGDGIVTGNEQCDLGRGNGSAYWEDGCTLGCSHSHFCGDGIVDSAYGEECDLGNANGAPIDGRTYCSMACRSVMSL